MDAEFTLMSLRGEDLRLRSVWDCEGEHWDRCDCDLVESQLGSESRLWVLDEVSLEKNIISDNEIYYLVKN